VGFDGLNRSPRTEKDLTVLSTAALAIATAGHPVWGGGWWFFFIPLFWITVLALIFFFVGRRHRRYWAQAGYPAYGPGGHGPWGPGHWGSAAASAETVLSERFARGDIDEQEYRARLEVLRASSGPTPPPNA
jgi:putative membrane protein